MGNKKGPTMSSLNSLFDVYFTYINKETAKDITP